MRMQGNGIVLLCVCPLTPLKPWTPPDPTGPFYPCPHDVCQAVRTSSMLTSILLCEQECCVNWNPTCCRGDTSARRKTHYFLKRLRCRNMLTPQTREGTKRQFINWLWRMKTGPAMLRCLRPVRCRKHFHTRFGFYCVSIGGPTYCCRCLRRPDAQKLRFTPPREEKKARCNLLVYCRCLRRLR